MRVLAIGDPHGDLARIKKIPLKNIDLILLTGDLGSSNLMRKMAFLNVERRKLGKPEKEFSTIVKKRAFMEAFNSSLKIVEYLSKKAKVFTIYGNVENRNSETKKLSGELGFTLPLLTNGLNKLKRVSIINNRVRNVCGLRIGGLDYFIDTCWVREFKPSDYKDCLKNSKRDTSRAKKVLEWFNTLDILVCHQPPYGHLDRVTAGFAPKSWKGKNAGSKVILDYIKKKQPRYVFCGHIHEGKGFRKIGKTEVHNLGFCGWKIVNIE